MEWIKKGAKRKKGFTLVEIIVVLVILAILAAFTIPSMLGFVNEARGKAYIAEAREVYVAAQAIATEYIATTDITDENINNNAGNFSVIAHGNASNGTGLAASISSFEVAYRNNNSNTQNWPKNRLDSPQVCASYEMYRYISNDLQPDPNAYRNMNSGDLPKDHNAMWIVSIGDGTDSYGGSANATRTGKVTKVVYKRDGYQVTITGNDATVIKYK